MCRRKFEAWTGAAAEDRKLCVTIKKGEEAVFRELIWTIYTRRTTLSQPKELLTLMLMADLYQVDGTVCMCAEALTSRPVSVSRRFL